MQQQQQRVGLPPRPPPSQMGSLGQPVQFAMAQPAPRATSQVPAVLKQQSGLTGAPLALLSSGTAVVSQGTAGAVSNANQSMAGLREQADRMLQQARSEQKQKEDMVIQLQQLRDECTALKRQLEQRIQENAGLKSRALKGQEEAEELRHKISELCILHRALEEGAKRAGLQLEQTSAEVVVLKEMHTQQHTTLQSLLDTCDKLTTEREKLRLEWTACKTAHEQTLLQLKDADHAKQALAADLQRVSADADAKGQELEALKAQVKDLTTRLHQAELEAIQVRGQMQQEVAAARQEVEQRLTSEKAVIIEQLETARQDLAAVRSERTMLHASLTKEEAVTAGLRKDLQASETKIAQLAEQLSDLNVALGTVQAQLVAAREQAGRLEADNLQAWSAAQEADARAKELEGKLADSTKVSQGLQEKLEAEIGSRESSIKQALAAAEEDKARSAAEISRQAAHIQELETSVVNLQKDAEQAAQDASKQQAELTAALTKAKAEAEASMKSLAAAQVALKRREEELSSELVDAKKAAWTKQQRDAWLDEHNRRSLAELDDQKRKAAEAAKKAAEEIASLRESLRKHEEAAKRASSEVEKERKGGSKAVQEAKKAAEKDKEAALAALRKAMTEEAEARAQEERKKGEEALRQAEVKLSTALEEARKSNEAAQAAAAAAAMSAKEEIAKLVASAEADKQAAVQQEKAVAEKQVQELKAQLEEALAKAQASAAAAATEQAHQTQGMQAKVSGLESELEGLRLELAASKAAAEQLRTEQEQLRAKHEQELEQQRQHQQELEQKQATLLAAQQDPKPASATRKEAATDSHTADVDPVNTAQAAVDQPIMTQAGTSKARKVPPPPRFDDVVPRMSDLLNNDKPADMTQAEPLGRRDNKQASKAAGPSNKRKAAKAPAAAGSSATAPAAENVPPRTQNNAGLDNFGFDLFSGSTPSYMKRQKILESPAPAPAQPTQTTQAAGGADAPAPKPSLLGSKRGGLFSGAASGRASLMPPASGLLRGRGTQPPPSTAGTTVMGNAISASAELGTQAQASAGNNLGRKSGLTVGGPKSGGASGKAKTGGRLGNMSAKQPGASQIVNELFAL